MKRSEVQGARCIPRIQSYDGIPDPPKEGVLIRIQFCGICHSDIHHWQNATSSQTFPYIYGHEPAGIIHSFGKNANRRDLKIGDKVMVFPWVGCGSCDECDNSRDHLCMDRAQETGFGSDGGYSNYIPVKDAKFLVKVPENLPMEVACMLPCSGLTSYSALEKVRPVLEATQGKKYLLVVGAGGLGLWCLHWAKLRLPKETIVVCADIDEAKLQMAAEQGADDTILWSNPVVGETDKILERKLISDMRKKSDGRGFNASIDFVNSSVTSARAFTSLKKDGTHVAVGLFEGTIVITLQDIVRQMKCFRGSYTGSLAELRQLVDLVASSTVKHPPIIYYELEDVGKAWEILQEGKMPGRAVIKHK